MSRFTDLFQEQPTPVSAPEPTPEPVKSEKVIPITNASKKKKFTMD